MGADLIEESLQSARLVISVMGPHAGEQSHEIFARKIRDIDSVGWTLWVINSNKASLSSIQKFCEGVTEVPVVFVEPSRPGGAKPTSMAVAAREYSPDKSSWSGLPSDLGPVTGKIDRRAYAVLLRRLELLEDGPVIDLHQYSDFSQPDSPIAIKIGASTVCAIRKPAAASKQPMKSRFRKVIACGQLSSPGAVWLR